MGHRITVKLAPESPGTLPFTYREEVQGLIYRALPEETSRWLHEEGIATERGRWKPFVFARLFGKLHPDTTKKVFAVTGPIFLKVATPDEKLAERIVLGILAQGKVRLGGMRFFPTAAELIPLEPPTTPVTLVARSPVTVFTKEDGRRRYFGANEPEFAKRLVENLRIKAKALGLEEAAQAEAKITPLDPVPHNKKVERFKKMIIEGWMGRYLFEGSPELAWVALTSGLGALGSQGFGFVEVAGDRRDREDR